VKERTGAVASAAAKAAEFVKRIVEALTAGRTRDSRYWHDVATEAPEQTEDMKMQRDQQARRNRKL
jgi:hypothetical protein